MQGARPLGRLVRQTEGVTGNLVEADDDHLCRRIPGAAQLEQRA